MTLTIAPFLLDVHIEAKRHAERYVLRDFRLRVRQGEIVSLIGSSGCGKSTLLALISGLDQHYRGSVLLDGVEQHSTSSQIGFIFQEPHLFPWLTVAQNIGFAATASATSFGDVTSYLADVGLSGYGDALPKQLSGGQAQRVSMARGLFTRPRILLLDEPFSAVDAFTRLKLQQLLLRVARQHGLTIVLVTHDIDEALNLSDRIALMDSNGGPIVKEYVPEWPENEGYQRNASIQAQLKSAILHDLDATHIV